jgi:dipeptidyl aminopeptidase/acylaminoacyl peptidase
VPRGRAGAGADLLAELVGAVPVAALIVAAGAAPLRPLPIYDVEPRQTSVWPSPDGTRLAWIEDAPGGGSQVAWGPISTPLVADGRAPFPGALWALWGWDERLYVFSDGPVERIVQLDPGSGLSRPVAEGETARLVAWRADRVVVAVVPARRDEPAGPSVAATDVDEEITVYGRARRRFEIRSIDVETLAARTTWSGAWWFDRVWVDDDDRPVAAARWRYSRERFDGEPQVWADALDLFGFAPEPRFWYRAKGESAEAFVVDGRLFTTAEVEGRSSFVEVDEDGARVILQSPGADLSRVWLSDAGGVDVVAVEDDRERWSGASPGRARALDRFGDVGEVRWSGRFGDRDYAWIQGPTEPGGLYAVTPEGARLGPSYGPADGAVWQPMESARIPARDGLSLPVYLTRPDPEVAGPAPWPLVLAVHGGPHMRDTWSWNAEHQRLSDLGYAVLSVQFRGSAGFGEAFVEAGVEQWGRAMQDDLLDGVAWAVARGVADPARVAILGHSYGGYAAMQALTTTPPGTFACGVAGAAPGTLVGPRAPRVLDEPEADRPELGSPALRRAASPETHAAALSAPLLLWHGDQDRQVPLRSVQGFVDAVVAAGGPLTFLRFPRGRHGLAPDDEDALDVVVARFLRTCLGGRAEEASAMPASASVEIVHGALP